MCLASTSQIERKYNIWQTFTTFFNDKQLTQRSLEFEPEESNDYAIAHNTANKTRSTIATNHESFPHNDKTTTTPRLATYS